MPRPIDYEYQKLITIREYHGDDVVAGKGAGLWMIPGWAVCRMAGLLADRKADGR